jgi:hypothetical protein
MTPDFFSYVATATTAMLRQAITRKGARRIPFNVFEGDGSVRVVEPYGRDAWALGQLIGAGDEGCTPLDHPGPRWSGYVFKLKRVYGLDISTIHEAHGGQFKGTHARYVLISRVRFADPADASNLGGDHE